MCRILIIFLIFFIISTAHGQAAGSDINEYYGTKWNGFIPHFQPFNTTDYYGSGDLNLDTKIDQDDITALKRITSGETIPNIRADVNGDNEITVSDEELLFKAINGDTLPAWWNVIPNRDKKISWLKNMLSIDKTDQHPYITGKYECSNFANQFFRNFTGYNDFSEIGSQTIYNLPVYYVLINSPSATPHNINAILIGDNPDNFSDWIFIEPQNDELLSLNNYAAGTQISMMPLQTFPMIIFELSSEYKWELKFINASILQKKPSIQPIIQNNAYKRNPVIISGDRIIFERVTDDMSRTVRLHVADLDSITILSGNPLTTGSNRTQKILAKTCRTGRTDLIWQESCNDSITYFFGSIEPDKNQIQNIQRLDFLGSGSFFSIDMYISGSRGFIFWLSNNSDNVNKLFYSEMINGEWQTQKYIEIAKSDYPLIDYEAGEDQFGVIHLFTTVKTLYWCKLVVYSFDNEWKNSYQIDYVIGKKIFYAGNKFLLSEARISNKASDIAVYSKSGERWTPLYSVYYGIPHFILESGIPEQPLFIIGTAEFDGNYFLEIAAIRDSYVTDHKSFHDSSVSENITGIIENKQLKLAWQNNSDYHIEFMKYNMDLTAVSGPEEMIIEDVLIQNYPNPFNSETQISYELKASSHVNIKVYDILGREVVTLKNELQNAGEHNIRFFGGNLESGIYFYKLTINERVYTKKMILVK